MHDFIATVFPGWGTLVKLCTASLFWNVLSIFSHLYSLPSKPRETETVHTETYRSGYSRVLWVIPKSRLTSYHLYFQLSCKFLDLILFNLLFIYSHKNLPSFFKTNLCLLDIEAQKCNISGFICTSPKLTLTACKIVNYAPHSSNSQAHFSGSERLRLEIKRRSRARSPARQSGGGINLLAALAGGHKQTSKPLYQLIWSILFCCFAFTSVGEAGNKTCFLFIYQISIVMVSPSSIPRWLYSICGRRSTRCWSSTTTPWPWRCPSCGRARWCPLPGPTRQTQRSWSSFSKRPSPTAGSDWHSFFCRRPVASVICWYLAKG